MFAKTTVWGVKKSLPCTRHSEVRGKAENRTHVRGCRGAPTVPASPNAHLQATPLVPPLTHSGASYAPVSEVLLRHWLAQRRGQVCRDSRKRERLALVADPDPGNSGCLATGGGAQ